mmetsp:Transcript_96370/g.162172  ORF Transcript_96370/g.162172 Transcript_96370/m.162172 type:complete len:245 (-) Transcript_96370:157-891(-)
MASLLGAWCVAKGRPSFPWTRHSDGGCRLRRCRRSVVVRHSVALDAPSHFLNVGGVTRSLFGDPFGEQKLCGDVLLLSIAEVIHLQLQPLYLLSHPFDRAILLFNLLLQLVDLGVMLLQLEGQPRDLLILNSKLNRHRLRSLRVNPVHFVLRMKCPRNPSRPQRVFLFLAVLRPGRRTLRMAFGPLALDSRRLARWTWDLHVHQRAVLQRVIGSAASRATARHQRRLRGGGRLDILETGLDLGL